LESEIHHAGIEIGTELSFAGTAVGQAVEEQKPVFVEDVQLEMEKVPELRARWKVDSIHSSYIFPVSTSRRKLGALVFGTSNKSVFSAADIELMSSVASHVSVALDSALAVESAKEYQRELARERDRLKLLLEINNHIISLLEMNDLFRVASASIRKFFGSDFTGFWLFDENSKRFRCAALDFPGGRGLLGDIATPELSQAEVDRMHSRAAVMESLEDVERKLPPAVIASLRAESIVSLAHISLVSARGLIGVISLGSRRAYAFSQQDMDLLMQVATQISLALDNALVYGRLSASRNRLEDERVYLESEIRSEYGFEDIVGKSPALRKVLDQVTIVAPTDSTVLLRGETGTGKELIARAIHHLSSRRHHTFVRLNCAAIPSGLVESELFGHEKGAFTGALAQRRGRFELAHEGSLLLDEIGDISMDLQPKLLRAIQEHEFERLGSNRTIHVDVRLITATHRDLAEMIREGRFREDLFYRLNVFPIEIPPLRERREDIPLLVHYFVSRLSHRMQKQITVVPKQAMDALANWDWPGNIRELENFIERAVILTQGDTLNAPLRELNTVKEPRVVSLSSFEDAEKGAIIAALRTAKGRISGKGGAADHLGLKRTSLQNKMRRLNITRTDYSEQENFVKRAVILKRGKSLDVQHAKFSKATPDVPADRSAPGREEIVRIVRETIGELLNKKTSRSATPEQDEKQRQTIMSVLSETKGRVGGANGAAARVGINRTTLLSRMKTLGINPKQFS
jgi:formate hydrogenlyase transcriptional activator